MTIFTDSKGYTLRALSRYDITDLAHMASNSTTLIKNRFQFDPQDESAFLGRGGMGAVYRGIDLSSQTPVAVKMMRTDLLDQQPDMVARFQQEGEALRQLNHPNIVKMLGSQDINGTHYLVMEYVSGGSLRDVLEEQRKVTVQRALYTALDLADALTRAHRLKILHRDIKPDNVLLADDGTPRLTDFGMARFAGKPHLTEDGAIVGTMAYLAPEAFMDEEPDERTDIWAFGIMFYEMLTGQRPFPQDQPASLINAIMTHSVPDLEALRPDLPTALVDLIYRMLAKDRQARIPSVRLIGAELEALIRTGGETPTSVQPLVSLESTGRFDVNSSDISVPTHVIIPQTSTLKVPNNLPNQPTAFVGRQAELSELETLLDTPGTRMITILGPGGMGKTRIALELATRRMDRHADGAFFVALAGVDSAEHVLPAIADQLDFSFASANPMQDLINYLREKNMLLMLDNFEHVTDCADIVSNIITNAPDVTVVVTSRERLRLRGEQVFEVNGMRLPLERDETPAEIRGYPACELFLQSARRVVPDFEIDDDETAHNVAEIIRLVGGLPLGIELAAAWLEALPPDEIVEEIHNSLDFLETDLRDVPERHRSVRAVFEYSWNLMTDDERETFKKLSIFRGGFERDAAKHVAGASLRTLTNLVNKSLLQREATGRYYVQKLLRQYAEERFEDDSAKNTTLLAHADYYASFVAKLTPAFNTRKEGDVSDAIETEIENIRLMKQTALDNANWEMFDRSLDAMVYYFISRSFLREGYASFKDYGDAIEAKGQRDTMLHWRIRARQAWMGQRIGHYDEVMRLAGEAAAFFAAQGAGVERSYALSHQAYVHMMRGDFEQAIAYSQQALTALTGHDELNPYFLAMGNMGYAHYLQGQYQQAREIYDALMARVEPADYSPVGKAFGYNNLGEILRDTGETSRAMTYFQDAFAIFEKSKHRRGMAFTLNNIAGVLFVQGHYAEAREKYQRAYELNRDVGDQTGIAHSLSALGNSEAAIGEHANARKHYEASLQLRRETGDKQGIADSLSDLARNAANHRDYTEAREKFEQARALYVEIGDRIGEGQAIAGKALLCLLAGYDRDTEARELLEQALTIGVETNNVWIRTQALVGLGESEHRRGHVETALDYYRRSLSAYDADEAPLSMILMALLGIAHIRIEQGDSQRALELVTLVLRYPPLFIGMIQEKAHTMLDALTAELGEQRINESMTVSKTLKLRTVVEDLLALDGQHD